MKFKKKFTCSIGSSERSLRISPVEEKHYNSKVNKKFLLQNMNKRSILI